MTARHSIGALGALAVLAGLVLAGVALYQLLLTPALARSAQRQLRADFAALDPHLTLPRPGAAPPPLLPVDTAGLAPGTPVAHLVIPRLSLDMIVVEGVGEAQLQAGPGHYPGTALPGQNGNAAIAGHRTTWARPFWNLQQLVRGDEIEVTTRQGAFVYEVTSSQVVSPTDVAVLRPTATPTLTLTTCTPRFSAVSRLVVRASLVSGAVAQSPRPPAAASTAVSAPLQPRHPLPLAALATALLLAAAGAMLLLVRRRQRLLAAVMSIVAAAAFAGLVVTVSGLLPATW